MATPSAKRVATFVWGALFGSWAMVMIGVGRLYTGFAFAPGVWVIPVWVGLLLALCGLARCLQGARDLTKGQLMQVVAEVGRVGALGTAVLVSVPLAFRVTEEVLFRVRRAEHERTRAERVEAELSKKEAARQQAYFRCLQAIKGADAVLIDRFCDDVADIPRCLSAAKTGEVALVARFCPADLPPALREHLCARSLEAGHRDTARLFCP